MAGGSNPAAVTQPRMAGPTPLPSAISPAASNNIFSQASGALTDAMGGARNLMGFQGQQVGGQFGYTPQSVGTQFGYNPQQVAAQQAAGGIQTYMNPFTQQVIDTSMADLERQRQMQMNQLGAQASSAGAFGGSRQGVAESLTNEAFARQGGQLAAGLRQQGFQTALGAAQQDVANQMQAALANQAAMGRAQEFGQGTSLQAQMANQAARARAQEFGQGTALEAQRANQAAAQQAAALRLQAGSQLGGLGQTGFGMGQDIIGMQQEQGRQQRAINQALIDAARRQFGGFAGAPAASIGLPLEAVGAANMGQRTQTQRYNPGLFDYLSFGAGIGGGIF